MRTQNTSWSMSTRNTNLGSIRIVPRQCSVDHPKPSPVTATRINRSTMAGAEPETHSRFREGITPPRVSVWSRTNTQQAAEHPRRRRSLIPAQRRRNAKELFTRKTPEGDNVILRQFDDGYQEADCDRRRDRRPNGCWERRATAIREFFCRMNALTRLVRTQRCVTVGCLNQIVNGVEFYQPQGSQRPARVLALDQQPLARNVRLATRHQTHPPQ